MTAKWVVPAAKAIVGLAISALLAFNYAWAFAYTHPVVFYGALAISFAMFTTPIWMNMFGRPMRSWPAYYLFVVGILFLGVMGRFVVEALVGSASKDADAPCQQPGLGAACAVPRRMKNFAP